MICKIRLKTGFFETTAYHLIIKTNQIVLNPVTDDCSRKKLLIRDQDLVSISVIQKRNSEMEFQTKDKTYTGTLALDTDLNTLLYEIRKKLNNKIIYERGVNYEK